jgi:hypothetical protein
MVLLRVGTVSEMQLNLMDIECQKVSRKIRDRRFIHCQNAVASLSTETEGLPCACFGNYVEDRLYLQL